MQREVTQVTLGVTELKKRLAADVLAAAEAAASGGAGGGAAAPKKRRRAVDPPTNLSKFRSDGWDSLTRKVYKLGAWGGCGAVAFQMNPRDEKGKIYGVLGEEALNGAEQDILLAAMARVLTMVKARVAGAAAAVAGGAVAAPLPAEGAAAGAALVAAGAAVEGGELAAA
jgi:hypothetical protein